MLASSGDGWDSGFQSVIRSDERDPSWYVVRYAWPSEAVLFRIFRMTNQEHRVFTYDQKENGRKGKVITRSWLPGYVFLEIDLERDFWQQIYQMPGFLEILGRPSPISQAEFDVLEALIPKTLPKKDPGLSFNAGDSVMIIDGPWTSFPATIKAMTPDGKDAELVAMMFGRPSTFTLPVRAIEKI